MLALHTACTLQTSNKPTTFLIFHGKIFQLELENSPPPPQSSDDVDSNYQWAQQHSTIQIQYGLWNIKIFAGRKFKCVATNLKTVNTLGLPSLPHTDHPPCSMQSSDGL